MRLTTTRARLRGVPGPTLNAVVCSALLFMSCDLFPEVPPRAQIQDATDGAAGSGGTSAAGQGGDGGASGQGATGGAGGLGGAGGDLVAVFAIADGADDVNEDGSDYLASRDRLWLGTGDKVNGSHTGLRFLDVNLPPGATIRSARLMAFVPVEQGADMFVRFGAEASDDCLPYSSDDPPSERPQTQAYQEFAPMEPWLAETWVSIEGLETMIAEVVDRPGWQPGGALCLEAKGKGEANKRRRVGSYEGDPASSPRLEVVYTVE